MRFPFTLTEVVVGADPASSLEQSYAAAGGFGLAAVLTGVVVFLYAKRDADREKAAVALEALRVAKDKEVSDLRDEHAKVVAAKDREIAELNKVLVATVEKQTGVLVEATQMFRRTEELFRNIAGLLKKE